MGGKEFIYTIQLITSRHGHEECFFRLEGVKNKNGRWRNRGKTRRRRECETNATPSRGRQRGGFHIPEHEGIETWEQTHAKRSGNTSSGGRTHPSIQPSQLLRKFLKSFIVVAPDRGISCEAGGGNIPRIVPLKQVGQ